MLARPETRPCRLTVGETEARLCGCGILNVGGCPGRPAAPALWPCRPPPSDWQPPDGRRSSGLTAGAEASSKSGAAPPSAPPPTSSVALGYGPRAGTEAASADGCRPTSPSLPGRGAGEGGPPPPRGAGRWYHLRAVSLHREAPFLPYLPPGPLGGRSELIFVKCLPSPAPGTYLAASPHCLGVGAGSGEDRLCPPSQGSPPQGRRKQLSCLSSCPWVISGWLLGLVLTNEVTLYKDNCNCTTV